MIYHNIKSNRLPQQLYKIWRVYTVKNPSPNRTSVSLCIAAFSTVQNLLCISFWDVGNKTSFLLSPRAVTGNDKMDNCKRFLQRETPKKRQERQLSYRENLQTIICNRVYRAGVHCYETFRRKKKYIRNIPSWGYRTDVPNINLINSTSLHLVCGRAREPELSSWLSLPLIKYWFWLGMETGLNISENNSIAQVEWSQHPKLYVSSWLTWVGISDRNKKHTFLSSYLISPCRYKSHHYCDADKLHFLAQKVLPFLKGHLIKEAKAL